MHVKGEEALLTLNLEKKENAEMMMMSMMIMITRIEY
jgi:hypothetical protein